jgi:hypothetical protein
MKNDENIAKSVQQAALKDGNNTTFATTVGVSTSTIGRIINGSIQNIDLGTWVKIYPYIKTYLPQDNRYHSDYKTVYPVKPSHDYAMQKETDGQVRRISIYGICQCASGPIDFGDIQPDGDDSILPYLLVGRHTFRGHIRLAAFKAEGESMLPDIHPGSICIFDPDAELQVGKFVLCKVKDEVLCKKWTPTNGIVILTSSNPAIEPMVVDRKKIEWVYRIISIQRDV